MEFQIFTPKPIKIEIAFGRGRGYWLGNQQRSAAFALIDPAVGSPIQALLPGATQAAALQSPISSNRNRRRCLSSCLSLNVLLYKPKDLKQCQPLIVLRYQLDECDDHSEPSPLSRIIRLGVC